MWYVIAIGIYVGAFICISLYQKHALSYKKQLLLLAVVVVVFGVIHYFTSNKNLVTPLVQCPAGQNLISSNTYMDGRSAPNPHCEDNPYGNNPKFNF